jgi:peptidoglycan/xylan/chitin deacetylase (PgdA/CDA1 family)
VSEIQRHLAALAAGRFVRVVNFHSTPAADADSYLSQLERLAKRFAPVTLADLDRLFVTGRWEHDRPGVLPVFYEGYRSHAEVVLPMLEALGLTGWFFIPTAFLSVPVPEQVTFARAHFLGIVDDEYADGRHALTHDELAAIGERHEVCAHTATHETAENVRTVEDAEREVHEPARVLRQLLGRPPAAFAWLFAKPMGVSAVADEALRAAGFRYLFSATRIQRLAGP